MLPQVFIGADPPAMSALLLHHRYQAVKLTASGCDLGGDMLFGSRLGFSGTPPNLLPSGVEKRLEPMSTAEIIDVLSKP